MRKNTKQFNHSGPRRGQKTLGWFLREELLEKTGGSSSSGSSPPIASIMPTAVPLASLNCSAVNISKLQQEEKQKRRRGGATRGRARKLTESLSTGSDASSLVNEPIDDQTTPKKELPDEKKGAVGDFYVYDASSDGYYYEQNGAKGWRRRIPTGEEKKKKEDVAAAAAQNAQQQQGYVPFEQLMRHHAAQAITTGAVAAAATTTQAAAAPLPAQQQAAAAAAAAAQPRPGFAFPPTTTAYNRYYDPGSDGYFFEMASVDGWRKRTNTPGGGPAPAGPTAPAVMPTGRAAAQQQAMYEQQQLFAALAYQSGYPLPRAAPVSYGAALARGEMPANYVIESSASSSASEDLCSSFPSLSRPTSLDLPPTPATSTTGDDDGLFTGWSQDKFIEDLIGQFSSSNLEQALNCKQQHGNSHQQLYNAQRESSMFARRFSIPKGATSSDAESSVGRTANTDEEDNEEEYLLQKELEKIWQTPTPVVGMMP